MTSELLLLAAQKQTLSHSRTCPMTYRLPTTPLPYLPPCSFSLGCSSCHGSPQTPHFPSFSRYWTAKQLGHFRVVQSERCARFFCCSRRPQGRSCPPGALFCAFLPRGRHRRVYEENIYKNYPLSSCRFISCFLLL